MRRGCKPHSDIGRVYSSVLPKDGSFAMVFHHVGAMSPGDLSAWRERVEAMEGDGPVHYAGELGEDIKFVYSDEREHLRHYFEHIWLSEPMRARLAALR